MKKTLLLGALALCATPAFAEVNHDNMDHSNHNQHSHHDHFDTAPLSVMGTHMHKKGEFMLSYQYNNMDMHGARQNQSRVDVADVHAAGYMMAPDQMHTVAHMFGAMYGLSENITLMAMVPYLDKSAIMRTMSGTDVHVKSKGLGDVKLTAMTAPKKLKDIIIGLGVSLPTGSIDEKDPNKLGYPMQLGSGSVEVLPSITWQKSFDNDMFVGSKAAATIRLHDNQNDYRLGNEYMVDAWVGKKITPRTALSLHTDLLIKEDISGRDTDLNAGMMPGNNPDALGRTRVNLGVSLNHKPKWAENMSVLAEYKMPIYEDLDGYMTETDNVMMFKIRKKF